jgi:hypothetical protein
MWTDAPSLPDSLSDSTRVAIMNSHYSASFDHCLSELNSTGNPAEVAASVLATRVRAPGREVSILDRLESLRALGVFAVLGLATYLLTRNNKQRED